MYVNDIINCFLCVYTKQKSVYTRNATLIWPRGIDVWWCLPQCEPVRLDVLCRMSVVTRYNVSGNTIQLER